MYLEVLKACGCYSMASSRTRTQQQHQMELRKTQGVVVQGSGTKKTYFSIESFLLLVCLTASLLILPLVLPPLPPPPLMLLLLPIGILLVLLLLGLMPSDVRDITSYL
ncbi:hypothetical protein IHE45_05G042900 [Dioscorea alata]|uniref:Uncharacterized protein n=1 Tax=Dioscorea alata TaxID=55571 RepID=A0ACB7W161_DIOAL|nr:hypothetical protein IHE45_05G042900 [Dioscorea alata]